MLKLIENDIGEIYLNTAILEVSPLRRPIKEFIMKTMNRGKVRET